MFRNFILICEFEWLALWNDKAGLLRLFLDPLAYLLFLGAGLNALITISEGQQTTNYISFVYPGIVALQILRMFTHAIYRLTIDRRWGLQALKIAAGTGYLGYILGMTFIPIILLAAQMFVSYPIALFLGLSFSLKGFFSLLFVGSIMTLFWSFLAINLTFWIKNYSQRDLVLTCLFTPLFLSAPIFYSFERAPVYLQIISSLNPLTYQVEAMRSAYFEPHLLHMTFYSMILITLCLFCLSIITLSKAEFLSSEI